MTTGRPTPTIAVVAVHGVGDHEPGVAARAVADLLLRLRAQGGSRYSSFVEHAVRIPTKPARVNPRSAPNVPPDLGRSIYAEQHAFLRTQLGYGGAAARDREEDSPDHQLMRAQLAEYHGTGEPYDTIRLEGERLTDAADGVARDVHARLHVYEMRWADLARPRAALARLARQFYQLFFHVAHLGRTALDHARLEHTSSPLWRAYGTAHTWAVRLLTIFVPALGAAMLTALGAAAALGMLGAVAPDVGDDMLSRRLAVGAWLFVVGGIVYRLSRAYERLRPGAAATGIGAYVLAATSIGFVAAAAPTGDDLVEGTLHVFEGAAVAASVTWDAVFLLGLLAGCLGVVACRRLEGAARDRARRAARTAAVTLVGTTLTVVVATLALLAAILRAVGTLLPERAFTAAVPAFASPERTYGAFFERVLEVMAGAGTPLLVLATAAAVAVVALSLAPALATESRPPRGSGSFDEPAAVASAPAHGAPVDTDVLWAAWESLRREGDASQQLGEWLTRGLRLAGAAVALLYVAVFLLAPAVSVTYWLTAAPDLAPLQDGADSVVLAAGACMLAAMLVAALRAPRGSPTRGLRAALDVLLAADTYRRTHPRDATPRARIAERYVSLLRYLCHWRDQSGRPYDAIVLVAHSQGAAITVDLLAFIQREEDPELEPIRRPLANGAPAAAGRRLYLLTTGNPLRQLYSEWFPHLFGWVRGDTGDGVSRRLPAVPREPWMLLPRLEDGHRVLAPAIPDAAAPDPYALGITRWVNAYRSGDYAGRALWRQSIDGCDWLYRRAPADAATRFVGDVPPITYASEDPHRSRRELCIGAGAHTRYWDATAKPVAIELDLLVSDATKLATRVAKDTGAPAEGMES